MRKQTESEESLLQRQWARVLKLATSGDIEAAVPAILRLPDGLSARKEAAEIDYRYLGRYLSGLDATDPLPRTVGTLLAGLCLYRAGDVAGSLEQFSQAEREARGITDARRASFLRAATACGQAWSLMRSAQLPRAVQRARAALAIAEETGSAWLAAHTRHALGRVLAADPKQRRRALALLEQAGSGYLAPEANDLRGAGYCLQITGRLRADGGDLEAGLTDLQRGLALMRRSHADRGAAGLLLDMGWVRAYQQSYAIARDLGRQAIDILDTCNDNRGLAKAHHLVGWSYLREGRTHEAEASFLRAHDYCCEVRSPAVGVACEYYLARCAFEMGEDVECAAHLAECAKFQGYDVLADLAAEALTAAQAVRRRKMPGMADTLRRLTARLKAAGARRVEADALFLVGFELCKADRLAAAAPLLRRALEVAADAQAANDVQVFLAANKSAALDRWMTAMVATLGERTAAEEELAAQNIAAAYGFHGVCNAVSNVYWDLVLHEAKPDEVDLKAVAEKAKQAGEMAGSLRAAFEAGEDTLKPPLTPFDGAKFILDQEEAGKLSTIGGLTYRTEIEPDLPLVMADDRALARVFGNFRTNAQNYAKGAQVVLSAKAHRNAKGEIVGIVLSFADNGKGIALEDQDILFMHGKRDSDYKQKGQEHGSGMGLAYCKVVIEKGHGGRIGVRSRPGHGATFWVELPVPRRGAVVPPDGSANSA